MHLSITEALADCVYMPQVHHDLQGQLLRIDASTVPNAAQLQELGQKFVERGVLDRRLLPWLWKGLKPPVIDDPAQMDFLVDLLDQLGLLTRLLSDPPQWLLPMRLPDRVEVAVAAAARVKFASFLSEMNANDLAGVHDMPALSLTAAVQSISEAGVLRAEDLANGCRIAFAKATQVLAGSAMDSNGLNCEEIAAINLYTQERISVSGAQRSNVYWPLNDALRSQDYARIRPFWQYISLLQRAVLKVPRADPGILYRGIKKPLPDILLEDLQRDCAGKKPVVWWAFSSTSTSLPIVKQFLGDEKRVIYSVQGSCARDVKRYVLPTLACRCNLASGCPGITSTIHTSGPKSH